MSPYVLLDDGFHSNPKVLEAGLDGSGLYARALSYCGAYLTDGHVTAAAMLRLADGKQKLVDRCVTIDLFSKTVAGYVIPDYLNVHDSRAEVEARRKQRQEAGRKGAAAKHLPSKRQSARQESATPSATTDDRGKAGGETVTRGRAAPAPTPSTSANAEVKSPIGDSPTKVAFRLFEHYQTVWDAPRSILTPTRRRLVVARLKDGYTEETMRAAIDGSKLDDWSERTKPQNHTFDLILRDGKHIESFAEMCSRNGSAAAVGEPGFTPRTAAERAEHERLRREAAA